MEMCLKDRPKRATVNGQLSEQREATSAGI